MSAPQVAGEEERADGERRRAGRRNPRESRIVGEERIDGDGQQEDLQREQDEYEDADGAGDLASGLALGFHGSAPSAQTVPSRTVTLMRPSGRCGGPSRTCPRTSNTPS